MVLAKQDIHVVRSDGDEARAHGDVMPLEGGHRNEAMDATGTSVCQHVEKTIVLEASWRFPFNMVKPGALRL